MVVFITKLHSKLVPSQLSSKYFDRNFSIVELLTVKTLVHILTMRAPLLYALFTKLCHACLNIAQ